MNLSGDAFVHKVALPLCGNGDGQMRGSNRIASRSNCHGSHRGDWIHHNALTRIPPRRRDMALVKLTHNETVTINLRVPLPVKQEMLALRKLADKYDVDFTATLAGHVANALRAIRTEIEALDKKSSQHVNGAVVNQKDDAPKSHS
jgi:hypothetical protein